MRRDAFTHNVSRRLTFPFGTKHEAALASPRDNAAPTNEMITMTENGKPDRRRRFVSAIVAIMSLATTILTQGATAQEATEPETSAVAEAPGGIEQPGTAAVAPEAELSGPADDFEVRWTPYTWAPGLKGESGTAAATETIDLEFTDILEQLDGGVTSYLRVFKGRWSVILDTSAVFLSGDVDVEAGVVVPVSGTITTERREIPVSTEVPINLEVEAEYEMAQYIVELFGGYQIWGDRFAPRSACPTLSERFAVDLLAGFRYVEIDSKVNIETDLLVGPVQTRFGSFGPVEKDYSNTVESETSWFDPVVGMQVDFAMTEKLGLGVRGDIGGFGVGSEFSWGLVTAAKYDFTDLVSGYAGYRILDIDYEETDFVFDAQMGGPIFGMMFRF